MTALTKRGKVRRRVSPGASLAERISLHTDRTGDCWLWTGSVDANGYGRVQVDRRSQYAHRVSYLAHVGPIPDGYEIDHLCRVRSCCNPQHLEAVTPQVNVRRGESVGARALRREVCIYGHPYAEHGTTTKSGRRICHLCQLTYMRLWKQVPYIEAMRRKDAGEPVVDLAAHFAEQRRQERAA